MKSLTRATEQVKCDLAGDPHSASRPAKAAMQRMVWGRTGRMADALGLAQRTIESWGNPADPQYGPLVQLDRMMGVALADGAAFEDATAPLAYLNDRFLSPASGEAPYVTVQCAAASALREAGEGIALAIEAARDGIVSEAELVAIEREVADAITALHRLAREAQAACRRPLRGKAFTQPTKSRA